MWVVEKGFFSHKDSITGDWVSHHAEGFLGALPTHPGLLFGQPRYGHYGPFCRSPYHVFESTRADDPTPTPQTFPEGSQIVTSYSVFHNTAFYIACCEKRRRCITT